MIPRMMWGCSGVYMTLNTLRTPGMDAEASEGEAQNISLHSESLQSASPE